MKKLAHYIRAIFRSLGTKGKKGLGFSNDEARVIAREIVSTEEGIYPFESGGGVRYLGRSQQQQLVQTFTNLVGEKIHQLHRDQINYLP